MELRKKTCPTCEGHGEVYLPPPLEIRVQSKRPRTVRKVFADADVILLIPGDRNVRGQVIWPLTKDDVAMLRCGVNSLCALPAVFDAARLVVPAQFWPIWLRPTDDERFLVISPEKADELVDSYTVLGVTSRIELRHDGSVLGAMDGLCFGNGRGSFRSALNVQELSDLLTAKYGADA